MSIADDLSQRAMRLADLSHIVAMEAETMNYVGNQWDHGLIANRIELTLQHLDSAREALAALLDRQQQMATRQ